MPESGCAHRDQGDGASVEQLNFKLTQEKREDMIDKRVRGPYTLAYKPKAVRHGQIQSH